MQKVKTFRHQIGISEKKLIGRDDEIEKFLQNKKLVFMSTTEYNGNIITTIVYEQ